MDAQVRTQTTIAASPQEVFRYLADTRSHYLWNPHLEKITPASLQELKEGTTYTTTSLLFGMKVKATNLVTECVQNKFLCIKNDTGLLCYFVKYTLKPTEEGTLLICHITVTADSKAFAFAKPVLKTLAQRELQSDLEALKLAIEEKLEYPV